MRRPSALLLVALLALPLTRSLAQGAPTPAQGKAGAQAQPAAEAKADAKPGAAEPDVGPGDESLGEPAASTPSDGGPNATQLAPAAQARRALEIEAREVALRALEVDVQAKIDELRKLQVAAQETLEPKRQREVEDVAKLVKFYQAMKPQAAAKLLEDLPLPLATSVLRAMKPREASKILNVMTADRAVEISRLMAGK